MRFSGMSGWLRAFGSDIPIQINIPYPCWEDVQEIIREFEPALESSL
jgi:hypothetical protein